MKPFLTLFTALLLAPTAVFTQAKPDDPYTGIYRTAVERRMQAAATRHNPTKKGAQQDISTACAAWQVGARTGEARYRDFALELYDRYLKEPVDQDFHVSRPFGLVTLELHHLLLQACRPKSTPAADEPNEYLGAEYGAYDTGQDRNVNGTGRGVAVLSLAGDWRCELDPDRKGVEEQWFSKNLARPIRLPGTLDEAGYGTPRDERTLRCIAGRQWRHSLLAYLASDRCQPTLRLTADAASRLVNGSRFQLASAAPADAPVMFDVEASVNTPAENASPWKSAHDRILKRAEGFDYDFPPSRFDPWKNVPPVSWKRQGQPAWMARPDKPAPDQIEAPK